MAYPNIVESLSPQLAEQRITTPNTQPRSDLSVALPPDFIARLSFSHILEFVNLADTSQRRFYELECARGSWSVRELRRQIASLY